MAGEQPTAGYVRVLLEPRNNILVQLHPWEGVAPKYTHRSYLQSSAGLSRVARGDP